MNTAASGDQHDFNPTIPTEVGALLGEEITIDAYSPQPSFLEMMMIEEAESSALKSLVSIMDHVQLRLSHACEMMRRRVHNDGGGQQSMLSFTYPMLRVVQCLLRNYGPELRMLFVYAVQKQCLFSSAGATMGESIYGAKRVRVKVEPSTSQETPLFHRTDRRNTLHALHKVDRTRLALWIACSSYAKERLYAWYQRQTQRPTGGGNSNDEGESFQPCLASVSFGQRWRRWLTKTYPSLHMSYEGFFAAYRLLYLVGATVFFDPSSHLLGLAVRRTTFADTPSQQESPNQSHPSVAAMVSDNTDGRRAARMKSGAIWTVSALFAWSWIIRARRHMRQLEEEEVIRRAPAIVDDNDHRAVHNTTMIPPPPEAPPKQTNPSQRIRVGTNTKQCPLCQQTRIRPVASTSGYVFCHRCLVIYVRQHGTCPLTGLSCPEDRIVEIYEPAR